MVAIATARPPHSPSKYYAKEEQFWAERQQKLQQFAAQQQATDSGSPAKGMQQRTKAGTDIGSSPTGGAEQQADASYDRPNNCVLAAKGNVVAQDWADESLAMLDDLLLFNGTLAQPGEEKRRLEIHKYVLALAGAREELHSQMQHIEDAKLGLAEQKLAEQQRVAAHLNTRTAAASLAYDAHLDSLHQLSQDVERHAQKLTGILRGSKAAPSKDEWQRLLAGCDRLLRQKSSLVLAGASASAQQALIQAPESPSKSPQAQIKRLEAQLRQLQGECDDVREAKRVLERQLDERKAQRGPGNGGLQSESSCGSVGDQLDLIRQQYDQAIRAMEATHKAELRRLSESGSSTPSPPDQADTSHLHQEPSLDPMQMLKEAVNLPGAAAPPRPAASFSHKQWGAQLKAAYQNMLADMQARAAQDKARLEEKYKRQLAQQAEHHEAALKSLIKHGRFNGPEAGQDGEQSPYTSASLEVQLKLLLEENAGLKGKLAAVADAADNKVEFALYQQRKRHQEAMAQLCEQHAQQLLDAKQGKDGALEGTPVKERIREAVALQVAEQHAALLRQRDAFEATARQMQADYQAALDERESEYGALLDELRELRRRCDSTAGSSPSSDAGGGGGGGGPGPPRWRHQPHHRWQGRTAFAHSPIRVGKQANHQQQLLQQTGLQLQPGGSSRQPGGGPSQPHMEQEHRLGLGPQNAQYQPAGPQQPQQDQRAQQWQPDGHAGSGLPPPVRLRREQGQAEPAGQPAGAALAESPTSAMVNAVLGSRIARRRPPGIASPAKVAAQHAQQANRAPTIGTHLRQLQQQQPYTDRQAGPAQQPWAQHDESTQHAQQASRQPGLATVLEYDEEAQVGRLGGQDQAHDQAEPDIGHAKQPRCTRCGRVADDPGQCSFHPYLLAEPGPFLYTPEWHACQAAGHTEQDPGCYSRQGHYHTSGVISALLAAKQRTDAAGGAPQPRTQLPIPSAPHRQTS